jgi:hypothetical protein
MTTDQLMIDAARASWRKALAQASETFNSLTDDRFQRERPARITSFTVWATGQP